MASREEHIEALRQRVSATIRRATDLLADIRSLDDWLATLLPRLAEMTEAEREAYVARLCGYDGELPERLRTLVESLADVLAGLTSADGGQAWLTHRLTRLETGDTDEAA